MTMIATCGHEIEIAESAAWMDFDEDFIQDEITRVVSYGVLCDECRERYRQWGILLESEQAKQDWLCGKTEYPKGD